MSSPFHDAVVAQMAGLAGAAPDANDFYYRNVRHAPGIGVGVLHPSPSALLVPPTRAEIEAAIGLSRPGDSDSQKINALQSQVNILLRLFLSRSLSSSPRLRSGSGSPLVPSDHSRDASPPACFECPICHEPLTEKSFVKHISKWADHVDVRIRKGMCPGIKSADHPFLSSVPANYDGEPLVPRLQRLANHVKKMTRPGSNSAHTAAGTGILVGCCVSSSCVNFTYFQKIISRSRRSSIVLMLHSK
jgi:hypothetical protein